VRYGAIYVRITYAPHHSCDYQLRTPDRFFTMQACQYHPQRPVLLKRAGGALVLALPFSRTVCALPAAEPPADAPAAIAVNVDLGLKTLATVSVTQGLRPLTFPAGIDPSALPAAEFLAYFANCSVERYELARYFLDQPQLAPRAGEWLEPPQPTALGLYRIATGEFRALPEPHNFKRQLTNLQWEARTLRSKLDRYRTAHPHAYRHHRLYATLRREWKRVWKKIRNIHLELARQVATRIVHIARYHGARTIRFEDLRWAQHTAQSEGGYWLATWQVHWFHGEIIHRVEALAARYGIRVDLVYAKGTSQRCSACGQLGVRHGKVFTCPHCGRQLDSDLNAARNIAFAPLSPAAIRSQGRAPVPGRQRLTAPSGK